MDFSLNKILKENKLKEKETITYINKDQYFQQQLSTLIQSNAKSNQTLKQQNETEKLIRAFTSNNLKYTQQFKMEKEKKEEKKRHVIIKKVFQSPTIGSINKSLSSKTVVINPRNKITLKSESTNNNHSISMKKDKMNTSLKSTIKFNSSTQPKKINPKQVKWVSTKEVYFVHVLFHFYSIITGAPLRNILLFFF